MDTFLKAFVWCLLVLASVLVSGILERLIGLPSIITGPYLGYAAHRWAIELTTTKTHKC